MGVAARTDAVPHNHGRQRRLALPTPSDLAAWAAALAAVQDVSASIGRDGVVTFIPPLQTDADADAEASGASGAYARAKRVSERSVSGQLTILEQQMRGVAGDHVALAETASAAASGFNATWEELLEVKRILQGRLTTSTTVTTTTTTTTSTTTTTTSTTTTPTTTTTTTTTTTSTTDAGTSSTSSSPFGAASPLLVYLAIGNVGAVLLVIALFILIRRRLANSPSVRVAPQPRRATTKHSRRAAAAAAAAVPTRPPALRQPPARGSASHEAWRQSFAASRGSSQASSFGEGLKRHSSASVIDELLGVSERTVTNPLFRSAIEDGDVVDEDAGSGAENNGADGGSGDSKSSGSGVSDDAAYYHHLPGVEEHDVLDLDAIAGL